MRSLFLYKLIPPAGSCLPLGLHFHFPSLSHPLALAAALQQPRQTPGCSGRGTAWLSPAERTSVRQDQADPVVPGPALPTGREFTHALCLRGCSQLIPKCMRTVCCLIWSVCNADAQCTSYFFTVHLVFQHSGALPEEPALQNNTLELFVPKGKFFDIS